MTAAVDGTSGNLRPPPAPSIPLRAPANDSNDLASAGTALPKDLHLLTLNCWGLLHISALRAERLNEIGRQLANLVPTPHIVALQECWTQEDFLAIRRHTRRILPYAKFYHSGAFGGGLAILSCWPIEESSMFKYPLNGRPTAFWRGDWYVGKGIACAKIRYGPRKKDVVEVFNTHTHAPYEQEPNDSYLCHRTAQAWEMAKLLRGAAERGHLVLAMGDFNMLPLSFAHRLISAHAPVRDVWRVLHPDSSLGPADHPAEKARHRPIPTADFNLMENGATSDSVYNTWRWTKNQQNMLKRGENCDVTPDAIDPRGKRLDYIFASTGIDIDSPASASGWVIKTASVGLTERHPSLQVSLSDHFAVLATLTRHTPSAASTIPPRALTPSTAVMHGAFLAGNSPASSLHSVPAPQPSDADAQLRYARYSGENASLAMYDEILAMTQRYMTRERQQKYWRGVHFFAALLVWVGCLVAVWFSPANFVAFILMLVCSLGLTAGVIDGLLSLLFFSWELRGLKEFEWEIRNAKAIAAGGDDAVAGSDSDGDPPQPAKSQ